MFLWNTTLSTGKNAPHGVRGSVTLSAPLLPRDSTFNSVFGIQVDLAFLEKNGVPCANLKGYHGTGPGDSGIAMSHDHCDAKASLAGADADVGGYKL